MIHTFSHSQVHHVSSDVLDQERVVRGATHSLPPATSQGPTAKGEGDRAPDDWMYLDEECNGGREAQGQDSGSDTRSDEFTSPLFIDSSSS